MSYLLDTHAFLFAVFSSNKLGKNAIRIIQDFEKEIFVSTITFWEISLKYSLGKIEFKNVFPEQMPGISEDMGFTNLSISPHVSATYYKLPKTIHKDPFDRMLIWQAVSEKMGLISRDKDIRKYDIPGLRIVW